MRSCFAAIMLVGCGLGGCGNLNSIHRTLDTSNGQGVLIDIKQRGIFASTMRDEGQGATTTHPVVCAEPSPDALSAYAFDLAAQGKLPTGKSLSTTFASAESAAFVGLRTQSIQLLRDQFFRACEAYMNQAISASEYSLLIRRYQKQTVALLAIEQMTGVVSASAALVSASGSAQGSAIAFLQSVFEEQFTKINSLENEIKVPGINEERKKEAQVDIVRLKTSNDGILKSIANMVPEKAVTTTSGSLKDTKVASTPADVSGITSVIQHIVDNVTLTDDFLQICIAKFGNIKNQENSAGQGSDAEAYKDPKSMASACMSRMGIANNRLRLQDDIIRSRYNSILADTSMTQSQRREELSKISVSEDSEVGTGARQFPASGVKTMQETGEKLRELLEKLGKPQDKQM